MLSSLSSTIITVFGISHLLESPLRGHGARRDACHDFGQAHASSDPLPNCFLVACRRPGAARLLGRLLQNSALPRHRGAHEFGELRSTMQLRSMDIDFDSWRLIQIEKSGFEEPDWVALRRLLKLPQLKKEAAPTQAQAAAPVVMMNGEAWVDQGVRLPHGTPVRMSYNHGRQRYEGVIDDGCWLIDGNRYKSPSTAAGALTKTSLNGWLYWEAFLDGHWHKIADMRQRVADGRAATSVRV